ncbi:MAG TPA: universal stress protein [Chitinophagaceae bacterium]|nr:universal stress protein [Chitinophagaceae bacterium]
MKTIIVPTDFSTVAFNAAEYAVALAEKLNAKIILFHAYPLPLAFSEIPVPPQVFNTLQRDAEDFMRQAKADLEKYTKGRIPIDTAIFPGGLLTNLQQYSDKIKPYAVVMSSHGNAGLEKLLLGSETNAAVTHLSWPLIVVPKGAKFKSPGNIALACDYEKVTSTVPVAAIKDLVRTFKSKLFVLHVHPDTTQPYQQPVIDGAGDLQQLLADLHPSYQFLNRADITEAILDFIQKNDIELLIVLPKKYNFLESLFHKSKSKKLAREAFVPMMSFHEK